MLQADQPTRGMQFHKIGRFLSISPNMDLRIIVAGDPQRPTFFMSITTMQLTSGQNHERPSTQALE
jgi:hypothetical protein